ncbi:uncharacterized protein LOC135377595 [Ornithodoros turicata]|uniref:uncharacterized protein LOC135377595 n=1 Tax=Ornithodoros turicata TaxID=34597 RepID=UPI0031396C90
MVSNQAYDTSSVLEPALFTDVSSAKEAFLKSSWKLSGNGNRETKFDFYFNVRFCTYSEKRVAGEAAMGGRKGVLLPLKLKYRDVSVILQYYTATAKQVDVNQALCTGNAQKESITLRPLFTDRCINGAVYEFLLRCFLRACLTKERTFPVGSETIGMSIIFKLKGFNDGQQQAATAFCSTTQWFQINLPRNGCLTSNAYVPTNNALTCHKNRVSSTPKYVDHDRFRRTKEKVHVAPPPFLLIQSKDKFMFVFQTSEASELHVVPSFPKVSAVEISFSCHRSWKTYNIALSAPSQNLAFLDVIKSVVVRTSLFLFIYKKESCYGHWKYVAIGSTLDHLQNIEMEPASCSCYSMGVQRIQFTMDNQHPLTSATKEETKMSERLEGASDQEFYCSLQLNANDCCRAVILNETEEVTSAAAPKILTSSSAKVEKEDSPKESASSASHRVNSYLKTPRQFRSLSESSADQEPVIVRRGILKNSDWRRTVSESSDDVAYGSSLDSEAMFPAVSLESIQRKKTVSFNDHISQMFYRANSSILGRRRKNQKKAANKKRAAARIASCHSESTDTSGASSGSEASLEDLTGGPNSSLPEAKLAETIIA